MPKATRFINVPLADGTFVTIVVRKIVSQILLRRKAIAEINQLEWFDRIALANQLIFKSLTPANRRAIKTEANLLEAMDPGEALKALEKVLQIATDTNR